MSYKEPWYMCPKCYSDKISAGHFEPEGMYCTVKCETCGFEWNEIYRFSGNEDLEGNELDDIGNKVEENGDVKI